jgi:hypothetical protein
MHAGVEYGNGAQVIRHLAVRIDSHQAHIVEGVGASLRFSTYSFTRLQGLPGQG